MCAKSCKTFKPFLANMCIKIISTASNMFCCLMLLFLIKPDYIKVQGSNRIFLLSRLRDWTTNYRVTKDWLTQQVENISSMINTSGDNIQEVMDWIGEETQIPALLCPLIAAAGLISQSSYWDPPTQLSIMREQHKSFTSWNSMWCELWNVDKSTINKIENNSLYGKGKIH